MKRALLFLLLLSAVASAARVEAFLSPDNSFQALHDFIQGGNLYIASYTFTNPYIMDGLIGAKNITILIDASPAGGLIGKELLCEMQKNNISVHLFYGKGYMHAKYIIKGSAVLVSSENIGDDGYPKYNYGNRGYGVIVYDENIAKEFMKIFNEDMKNSKQFVCNLTDYRINYDDKKGKSTFQQKSFDNQMIRTIFAPNATDDILSLINSADKSLHIEQFYIYRYWKNSSNPFLEAAIERARNGVDVKILLDSIWYNVDKKDENSNFYTAEYVNGIARKENLSLEARLVDLDKLGFQEVHNKGMIVDESIVLVSSINWNENSPKNNREVGLVISGESAKYFLAAFEYDWSGGKEDNNFVLLISLVIVAIIIIFILVSRR
ncbi:MAG: phospholipase D-like domain-containing protein [Candidatus Aenigmatarchaeota archaeon]